MKVTKLDPQFVSKPRTQPPIMIVVHSTGGSTDEGAIETLYAKKLGYHFLIDKDGTVYQGCAMDRNCGHAGNSYGPKERLRHVSTRQNKKREFIAGCSVNDYSIGISFVQTPAQPLTVEQKVSAREVVKMILKAKPFITHIAGHKDVSYKRKIDPYSDFTEVLAQEFHLAHFKVFG